MFKVGHHVERKSDKKIGIIKHTDFKCNSDFNYQVYYSDEVRWEKSSNISKIPVD